MVGTVSERSNLSCLLSSLRHGVVGTVSERSNVSCLLSSPCEVSCFRALVEWTEFSGQFMKCTKEILLLFNLAELKKKFYCYF